MLRRVSLANKCLLLFGAAIVLIIMSALLVPWLRMRSAADESQLETSRQIVRTWEMTLRRPAFGGVGPEAPVELSLTAGSGVTADDATIRALDAKGAAAAGRTDPFVLAAWDALSTDPQRAEFHAAQGWIPAREYRYARAVRDADQALRGVIVLERSTSAPWREGAVNSIYLFSAACVALGLALLVFYLITNRIVLSPVRSLRDTADQVRAGNLKIRSEIQTGDEFEELAETFNSMLQAITDSQYTLRAINEALDKSVADLETQNKVLAEANRVKGEFLANVSHELRTPLNSVLGFADLLLEQTDKDAQSGEEASKIAKRKRALENIVSSGRHLLDLINGLLELAKVEAGKADVAIEPLDLRQTAEGLLALMRPMADRRGVELKLESSPQLPTLHTDSKKLHQIVFNLLSNAVKFTGDTAERHAAERAERELAGQDEPPDGGPPATVTLRVEPLLSRAPGVEDMQEQVRISVLDTGPGIAPENLSVIFEKFTQVDRGLTRRHGGTGLGLAITRELVHLLQGQIQVQSELGRGSMFSVILPVKLDPGQVQAHKLETRFRKMIASR